MDNNKNNGYIEEGFEKECSLIHNKGITMIIRKITFIGLIIGLLMVLPNGVGWTQAEGESAVEQNIEELKPVGKITNEISGLLAYLYPRGKPTQVTISNNDNTKDYSFKIDQNTKIGGKKNIKQFTMGDRIKIVYEEEISMKEDGKQLTERTAKQIIFLAPAITGLRSQ